jgi:serine phosphatase RsbU (regulator of sigma subunit)
MIGTVQDVTEGKKAEREHRIAETLQRSLLPDRLPEIPGVLLAARYLPATSDLEVGGDWYDVVQLPNGSMALAIGDVAGHGLRAASTMGQLRMALRAYALEEGSPSQVVGRVRRLVRVLVPDIVTLIYLVFDPESGTLRFANAGHPPPSARGRERGDLLSGRRVRSSPGGDRSSSPGHRRRGSPRRGFDLAPVHGWTRRAARKLDPSTG